MASLKIPDPPKVFPLLLKEGRSFSANPNLKLRNFLHIFLNRISSEVTKRHERTRQFPEQIEKRENTREHFPYKRN